MENLKLFDATPFGAGAGTDPYPLDGSGVYSLVPLTEPMRPHGFGDYEYPHDIYGETPQSGMANEWTFLSLGRKGPAVVGGRRFRQSTDGRALYSSTTRRPCAV